MTTIVTRAGKGSALTHNEVDANFNNLNNAKVEADQTVTLTNKTISGSSNTLSNIGNASLTNSSVTIGSTSVSLGSTATTVSGLTLTSPIVNTPTISGGTVNNAVIGGSTPAAITGTTITANTSFSGALDGTVGATTPNTGAFTTLSASGQLTLSGTGAAQMNVGTTAQRPTPATGMFRFNTSLSKFEGYTGTSWGSVGGGATGGGADEVFVETSPNVTTNYTLSTGKNAMVVGPMVVATGVTVTVPTGQRLVVI